MKQRLRVLMVAYACDPQGGGEHWLGWGWAREAARHHDVVLLAPPKAESVIRPAAHECGIEYHAVGLPGWLRRCSECLGSIGVWMRKRAWQRRALNVARRLHSEKPFDVVHQTTFHTFRIPFFCARLGIPSVWGPVAGGESVPQGFEKYLGPFAAAEARRQTINRWCLKSPAVQQSLKTASAILVSNRTTLAFLPARYQSKCRVVAPNAIREEDLNLAKTFDRRSNETFEIVFAGACAATRALPLVFEALSKGIGREWKMNVAGNGPALDFWKTEAERLGVSPHVAFLGNIPRDELGRIYEQTSVLVFPALRDSGGSAILDAMTKRIPILALDWAGPGEMVDSSSAVLVATRDPESTVAEIRAGLQKLAADPAFGDALAENAFQRAINKFSWEGKFEAIDRLYREVDKCHNRRAKLL
ncbi:MAG: glycosyltransferase family 4 protein [Verrucomicrobiales bacterium]